MRFVTAVAHKVENLRAASDFFCGILGFYPAQQGSDIHVLENGSVSIHLVEDSIDTTSTLHLDLSCKHLEKDTEDLLALPEVFLLEEKVQVSPYRLETRLQAPHNLIISLFQTFNEDDLGILPALPVSLDWEQQAIDCIQQLLTCVPVDFRELARKRTVERAEVLTAEQGSISVELTVAIQALVEVTPLFQHAALIEALRERAIDPTPYFPPES